MTYKFMVRGYNPPAGADRWVAGTNEQYVGYASDSDLTDWTFYDRVDDGHPCSYDVAYGKDASGNGIYIMTQSSSNKEVSLSSTDVTEFSPAGSYFDLNLWRMPTAMGQRITHGTRNT